MFWKLLALFTLVPLAELALLLYVGSNIGPLPTFAIVLLTGVIGTILARREGLRAWRNVQETLAAGQLPTTELVDGLLIVVAGALLLTPGMLTDIVGLSLLVPRVRERVRGYLRKRFEVQLQSEVGVFTLGEDDVEVRGEEPWTPDNGGPTSIH